MGKRLCQLLLLLAISVVPVLADSTLHIGPGYPRACDQGGCPLYKGETNGFTNMLDIYQNSAGAPLLNNPVEIIFAVPHGDAVPSISGVNLVDSDMSFSLTPVSFTALGSQGTMTSGDIYSFLGLKVNKSNNIGNLTAWDLAVNGLVVNNGFDIYVFNLNTAGFDANDFLTMNVNAPLGTFAVAYGTSGVGKHITPWGTPFTEAGLQDGNGPPPPQVPEPGSMLLLGSAMLSAAAVLRGKMMRSLSGALQEHRPLNFIGYGVMVLVIYVAVRHGVNNFYNTLHHSGHSNTVHYKEEKAREWHRWSNW